VNVFWHEGKPRLIDADNVLSRNHMLKENNGDIDQTGFSSFNEGQANANRTAIKDLDNSKIQSRILDAMMTDDQKRTAIIYALKAAISGTKGRVVPIRTSQGRRSG